MKAKIITKSKNTRFEPFTIKLTVENASDAVDLWHRFNLGEEDLVEASDMDGDDELNNYINDVKLPEQYREHDRIWGFLDEVLRVNNGRNK